jgi:hypothetical protein
MVERRRRERVLHALSSITPKELPSMATPWRGRTSEHERDERRVGPEAGVTFRATEQDRMDTQLRTGPSTVFDVFSTG